MSPRDRMAIEWARASCTVESNRLQREEYLWKIKYPCKYDFFHLSAGFHCSFAIVPGISHLAYAHVRPAFLQEVCISYDERVHQKKMRDVKGRFLEIWWLEKWHFLPRIFLKTGKNNRTGSSYLWGKAAFSVDVFHSTERHGFRPINLRWGQRGLLLFIAHQQSEIFSKHFNRILYFLCVCKMETWHEHTLFESFQKNATWQIKIVLAQPDIY